MTFRGGPDVPGGSQVLFYTPFDLPSLIATNTSDTTQRTTKFDYSADEERVVRRDIDTSTLHFAGDLYQRKLDTFDTTLEERFRLYAGDRQLGEIVRKDGADKTLFFHTDHLGSTSTISDSDGAVTQQDFDPFGAPLDPPSAAITRVGFTGQDQDIDLGLTDMKGRIYDPLAGRFTSADPVMQAPFWSQGLNRYSYVFDNPINLTDPSGFDANADSGIGIPAWGGAVVGIAALQGFGASAGAILGGTGFVGGNVATSLLTGQYDLFNAHGGSTHSVTAPSTTAASGINPKAPGAGGENKGGPVATRSNPRPLAFPKLDRFPRNPDLRLAMNCTDDPMACVAQSWADEMNAIAESAEAARVALAEAAIVALDAALDAGADVIITVSLPFTMSDDVNHSAVNIKATDSAGGEEHTKGARKSTQQQHEEGKARKAQDRGGRKLIRTVSSRAVDLRTGRGHGPDRKENMKPRARTPLRPKKSTRPNDGGDGADPKDMYKRALALAKRGRKAQAHKVLPLLRAAAEKGHAMAAHALATWYMYGIGVRKNFRKDVALEKVAARAGVVDAVSNLAIACETGKGVERNLPAAFRLYRRAARLGDVSAKYEVGRCYFYGIGTTKNQRLGRKWIALSSEE